MPDNPMTDHELADMVVTANAITNAATKYGYAFIDPAALTNALNNYIQAARPWPSNEPYPVPDPVMAGIEHTYKRVRRDYDICRWAMMRYLYEVQVDERKEVRGFQRIRNFFRI